MLPNTTEGVVVELYLYSVGVAIEMWTHNDFGQIIHTGVPLSPSSVIWYWPKGADALAATAGKVKRAWIRRKYVGLPTCNQPPGQLSLPSLWDR